MSHEQVLVLADHALYRAKRSGRNRAVGLLSAGETARGGTIASTIHIDGVQAFPVTTLRPQVDGTSSTSESAAVPAKAAAASTTS